MAISTASFDTVTSEHSLGRNLPQRVGSALWLPMFLMAAAAFGVGFILGIVRADEVAATSPDPERLEALRHITAGFMFLGFAAVFTAISFAIARILGAFRQGGGAVQEAAGRGVETLKMPATAKAFIAIMAMSMMAILVAVVLHWIFAFDTSGLELSEQRFVVLEGVRRVGVAGFLFSILLGLASIITVLRFQAVRLREIAGTMD
jgi:hypothetical protein